MYFTSNDILREMKSVLSLFGVIALFGIGLVHPVQGTEDSFPCTKLAEILPDAALTFAQEYFAWKNPDKINVSIKMPFRSKLFFIAHARRRLRMSKHDIERH